MANLSADANFPIQNQSALVPYPIDTTKTYYKGQLLQTDGSGNAIPVTVGGSTSYKILGRLYDLCDDGLTCVVQEGDLFMNLAATTTPTAATSGSKVYAYSDNELSTTSTAGACAGIFLRIDDSTSLGVVRCNLAANV